MKPHNTAYYSINQLRNFLWTSLKDELSEFVHSKEKDISELDTFYSILNRLKPLERYYTFPGRGFLLKFEKNVSQGEYKSAFSTITQTVQKLVNGSYRDMSVALLEELGETTEEGKDLIKELTIADKKYFEVVIVDELNEQESKNFKDRFKKLRRNDDNFVYELNIQPSFQDVLIALLFNVNVQSVVIRYAPKFASENITEDIKPFIRNILRFDYEDTTESELGPILATVIKRFRPDIDLYYITDTSLSNLKDSTISHFNRIFYGKEDAQELHLTILRDIRAKYQTPFFSALREYSKKPTGVFHAMPISRGNSVFKSHWISDFGEFYGRNVFLAETSSTTGGLDSLLQPTGPIKKAQEMAAKAYGAEHTFFVTNGTSTANKIVHQAIVQPGDIVLIDRDCHKSHHYALVLSGGFPVYLDSYPIEQYSMYGAVPLKVIKEKLLELKANDRLDKVKMLVLTNCTFDGLVYNPYKVMQEVLAIKPDMVFLWDEAWFAFAGFTYLFKQRTGMYNAEQLYDTYSSKAYRRKYQKHIASLKEGDIPSLPDPDKVRIRVYVTQSTHKTLSSFRQGSMIHVWDEDFRRKVSDNFHEAYMTHTSTSPNYQLLASLDVGRRQVQFEGFELVEKSIEMSMALRLKINHNEKLKKYFRILTSNDIIPKEYRASGFEKYYSKSKGWLRMEDAWEHDEFVLDPTKVTLSTGDTGVDGDTFKNAYLMDKFNIQINKTSRNTILLMTNIGTTSSSVAYLTNALLQIANELDERVSALNSHELKIHENKVKSMTQDLPPLPDFSHFHKSLQAIPGVPGGNIRKAYFLAYDEGNCDYMPLEECCACLENGDELVSTSFVIPYPPGFPVLVPGQVVSLEIIRFLLALDVTEIHGFRADLGLKVFKSEVLKNCTN